MYKIIYFSLLLSFHFVSNQSICQERFNFSTNGTKSINEVRNFENSIKSKDKGFSYFNPYFDEDFDTINPNILKTTLIFERTNDDFFPALATWYFFDNDSVVRGLFYNWGFYNPEFNPTLNQKILVELKNKKIDFIQKHKMVKMKIYELLGSPTSNIVSENSKIRLIEKTVWDLKNSRIILELVFDPTLVKLDNTEFLVGGDSHITIKKFFK